VGVQEEKCGVQEETAGIQADLAHLRLIHEACLRLLLTAINFNMHLITNVKSLKCSL